MIYLRLIYGLMYTSKQNPKMLLIVSRGMDGMTMRCCMLKPGSILRITCGVRRSSRLLCGV
ncbi:hypothetical protein AKJ16_DCAP19317 [Drosera capensis]